MVLTDIAGDLALVTAAYERLLALGVEVGEMRDLAAKLVGSVRETSCPGHCLMKWSFQMPRDPPAPG